MRFVARIVGILWIPVAIFALYTAWIFWQRNPTWPFHRSNYIPPDPMAAYGKNVRILSFYGPHEIASGSKALLCYSVVNATVVKLDPPVERLWPAVSRCFDVTPISTTHYTITAEGEEHATVSQSLDVVVGPPTGN